MSNKLKRIPGAPTKPGWYWVNSPNGALVAKVFAHPETNELIAYYGGNNYLASEIEWHAGPIEEPEEEEKPQHSPVPFRALGSSFIEDADGYNIAEVFSVKQQKKNRDLLISSVNMRPAVEDLMGKARLFAESVMQEHLSLNPAAKCRICNLKYEALEQALAKVEEALKI